MPTNRVSAIVAGRRGVTGDTALRLACAFGATPNFQLAFQSRFEPESAKDAAPDPAVPPVAA